MKRFLDTRYLRTAKAIVRIGEIFILAAAWISTLMFDRHVVISGSSFSRVRFFVMVTTAAWIVQFVSFILIVTRITRNLPVSWPWVTLALGVFFGLFCLLASAFMSSSIENMKGSSRLWYAEDNKPQLLNQCEYLIKRDSKVSCIALEIGAAFGFIATALFIIEVIICAREIRRGNYKDDPPQAAFAPDNVTISTSAAE